MILHYLYKIDLPNEKNFVFPKKKKNDLSNVHTVIPIKASYLVKQLDKMFFHKQLVGQNKPCILTYIILLKTKR